MTPTALPRDPRVISVLAEGLAELGLPDSSAAPLASLCSLLETWAARMSLTAHRDAEAIARRLVLDALALAQVLPASIQSVADLGSGAGFPGLPIAIVWPERQVTLVESRERRNHFQRAVIRKLRLVNTRALHGRSEELEATPHDLAIAQAMAEPSQARSWLLPWVGPQGFVGIPGTRESPPEIPSSDELPASRVIEYAVPLGGPRRTLWLAQPA